MSEYKFTPIQVRDDLGTKELIKDVVELMGPDDYGRKVPNYWAIHTALKSFKEQLEREKESKKGNKK